MLMQAHCRQLRCSCDMTLSFRIDVTEGGGGADKGNKERGCKEGHCWDIEGRGLNHNWRRSTTKFLLGSVPLGLVPFRRFSITIL